jgi:hypothetical protein
VAGRAVSAIAQNGDCQVAEITYFDYLDGEVGQAGEQTLPPAADSSVAVIAALQLVLEATELPLDCAAAPVELPLRGTAAQSRTTTGLASFARPS